MRIFQLTPIKPVENEQAWLSSTTKETLIVRAESEKRARQLAAFATGIAIEISATHHNSPLSPWHSDKHVSCIDYVGKQYQIEGNEEVLSPNSVKKEWDAMNSKRILLDTGVWISYFGDRQSSQQERINLAKEIINYCVSPSTLSNGLTSDFNHIN